MKLRMLLLLSCLAVVPLMARSDRCSNQEVTSWLASSLTRIEKIQAGMTRHDLEELFVSDGGISTLDHQTYVFRDCPYIKVDVEFSPATGTNYQAGPNPKDVINTVSRPYFAQPRAD
jgi:hypothetical protein